MSQFDTIIGNGLVVDGTGAPRLRGDVGIVNGRVAKIGRLDRDDAERVIDATDCVVAPGFVDLHTHYDAQIFWDPYCTLSGWHGVTSVAIGNCGFGFAPVAPEMRERMMLSMTRVEAIPFAAMKMGMPWDWVSYPEFLASLERTPKGVNVLPYVPVGPLLVWVLGLEDAKAGREPTHDEMRELKGLLHEAMAAGGCGWSAQRLPPYGGLANQRDYDGTPMPTDLMSDRTALELAKVLAERNEGFIQMTYVSGDVKHDAQHFEDLARTAGRPVLYNVVQTHAHFPQRHRNTLDWLDRCRRQGLPVYGQAITTASGMTATFEDWNLFDDSEAWAEATTGSFDEKLHKLADPARRQALRDGTAVIEAGAITGPLRDAVVLKVIRSDLKKYENLLMGEIAASEGKHVVDAMLDLAVADHLQTVFYFETVSSSLDLLKDVLDYPYSILGVSDGGAHTKFFTGGRYPTESIIRFTRDNELLSLEEIHWRLSALPAHCAGFNGRGTLRPGSPADIVVYNLEELAIEDMEVAHDLPGGEWRRVQRSRGYHHILVNGEPTFTHNQPTGAVPGNLLRHGGGSGAEVAA